MKEITNKDSKKIYGPYIGKIKVNNNKYEISVKKSNKKIKGGSDPEFVKKGDDCIFFKPFSSDDYQYKVCKTLFRDYEFAEIKNGYFKNIDIMMIDKESLIKLNEYFKKNNIFRTLQPKIEEIIQNKTKKIQELQNKNIRNFDEKLIEEAFVQKLNEHNNNTVITLGAERIKITKINGVTYIFFNPGSLLQNRNRNSHYYYRYFVFIKNNQIIFKEVFFNDVTSKINVRVIERINGNYLKNTKLMNDIDEIPNSNVKNIYKKLQSQYA